MSLAAEFLPDWAGFTQAATSGVNLPGSRPVTRLANKSSAPPTGKVTKRCKTLIELIDDMGVSESFPTVLMVILIFFV